MELVLADMDSAEKAIFRVSKKAKAGDKDAKAEIEVLEKVKAHLEAGLTLRQLELSPEEKALVSYMNFLTIKPTMYIANVLEDGFENNKNAILPYSPNAVTVRKALQTLGTEWGRDVLGNGIWANLLCARIERACANYDETTFNPVFLVSDHRFVSEGKVVREAYSRVYSVYVHSYSAQPQLAHRSEQELEEIAAAADFRIFNNGTLDELYNECAKIVDHINKTN